VYTYAACPHDEDATLASERGVGSCPTVAYFLYFLILAFMGIIVLVSLIIQEFGTFYGNRITKHADNLRVQAALASIVTYCELDNDNNGTLDKEELQAFFRKLTGASR
jgi:hypothetical protein